MEITDNNYNNFQGVTSEDTSILHKRMETIKENGDDEAHHQRQPPLHGKHDGQCADNRDGRDEQVLRAVMRQLRHLKQVRGQAAHQLTRAVLVVKIKAQLLHMAEQVPSDVRFHADAEGMAPVAHHEIEQ